MPSTTGAEPARVRLDGEVVADGVAVDEAGRLAVKVEVRRAPGLHEIAVEQRDGKRLTVERRRLVALTAGGMT